MKSTDYKLPENPTLQLIGKDRNFKNSLSDWNSAGGGGGLAAKDVQYLSA